MSTADWLGDVLLGASGAAGVEVVVDPSGHAGSSAAAARRLELPPARRACVVLVDGLGLHNLLAAAEVAPALTGAPHRPLQSGFPSTTATNMAALGTGLPGGRTGMLGYTVRNPATGRLLNLISWRDGPEPETWQQQPTIFELMAEQGHLAVSVGPWEFESSPLTRAALRGAEYDAAESLEERVDRTIDVLGEPDVKVVTTYWGDVDKTGHHHGWRSPQWREALAHLDAELARLAAAVPPETLLLVTADHGMVDIPLGESVEFGGPARLDVARNPVLADGVGLVAGEPRICHVHAEPGAAAAVLQAWRAELGERADVRSRDEAIAAGWFGPVEDRFRPVVGDVVAAMRGDIAVFDSRTQTAASLELIGMHGSGTAAERTVPLIRMAG
ncbi:alkaline phosphatase family protein [Pseudactinotalea suaedae]|uniref:alkaline phosphatase family protein n=1 Tax=Pseudactinotalea suaedae TaxID=1524924 RepID=UPI0012E22AFB|nr:nucleotide pyrophosphatase/phosphodiesterase family protein [Pseudactinotalea suaedae]